MKLNEYQELAARTIPYDKDDLERKKEFVLGLNEEAGEVAGVVKKVIFHEHPMNREKYDALISELGDVLWHVAALASEFAIDLEYIADYNVNTKLKKRYRDGFTAKESIEREDD